MFKGMFGGGAEVDTQLPNPNAYPGGTVEGVVNIKGGHTSREVNFVELAFTARVEVETEDSEYDSNVAFAKHRVAGEFRLEEGAQLQIPFSLQVPWESPFNVLGGQPLSKVSVGVRTELDIARSVDKGDVDALHVHALPGHEAILSGLTQLGFTLKGSDCEKGQLRGATLPFYQEVEFNRSPHFPRINELEVTFITSAQGIEVVLEMDKRGFFSSSDQTNRFHVDHATAQQQDWAAALNEHLHRLAG